MEVSTEEIRKALSNIHPLKDPGPDGYNGHFFKKAWSIVGGDIEEAISSFFSTGKLLKEVNITTLTLVPKKQNPSSLDDFRPISCCNFLYKCISKVIANRLKVVLPTLIDKAQAAFIRGRRISDILLAQELFRNYQRKDSTPRYAIKVDLRKAFDTLNWNFLLDLLDIMGFPPKMITWIRICITSPKFSILINGELGGYFSSTRGLR